MSSIPRTSIIETQYHVGGNYGGLLQAVALQRILREYGIDPVTNATVERRTTFRSILSLVKTFALTGSVDSHVNARARRRVEENLTRFAQENLALVPRRRFTTMSSGSAATRWDFDFAIAGSDQVWRPKYFDVRRGCLEHLANDRVRKFSYAASFGIGDLSEFDAEQLAIFASGIRKFDSVSVREDSAVAICRDSFGVDASLVLDPTMLLSAKEWERVAKLGKPNEQNDNAQGVLAYLILDPDPRNLRAAKLVADRLGLKFVPFYPPKVTSMRSFRRNVPSFKLPGVDAWLASIRDAELVVTDSFHVSAFSILFETPCLTMENKVRGNSRLQSLTRMFGLEPQLMSSDTLEMTQDLPEIAWARVRARLDEMRKESRAFLEDALTC